MTTRPHLRLTITYFLLLLFSQRIGLHEINATAEDPWWNNDWPFRVLLELDETGAGQDTLNFSQILSDLGLQDDAIMDLRSLQVVPYIDGIPGEPVPFTETFSQLIIDADEIGDSSAPDQMYWQIYEESTSIVINNMPKTQGEGSLHAHIEITDTTLAKTGFQYFFNDSLTGDWSGYEVLLYDIFPDVNEVLPINIPTLYLFRLEGLNNCPTKYVDGPRLSSKSWNGISLPLQTFGSCSSPDYSGIEVMQFIFPKDHNDYLRVGDILDIWVDNFRMFDQDADGQILWNAEAYVDNYYLYFDLLRYGETKFYLPIISRN